MNVIEVESLTKRYDATLALDAVSFSVEQHSITGLLGGNGAGKTTTLSILLGLLIPTAGSAHVLGVDITRDRHQVLHRMNFSSPYVELPHRLTVRENLTVYGHLYGVPKVRARIIELARDLDITELLDRPTGKLSAGQKTRVALAKALINRPDLLLLDEPTASLDPDTGDWVRSYLETFQRAHGSTIMLASHNMYEVERMCGNVLMMKQGRIVDRGAPSALIAHYGCATFLQWFAYALPSAHVFEGMRTVLFDHRVPTGHLLAAFGLNALYMALSVLFFFRSFKVARDRGALLQMGE